MAKRTLYPSLITNITKEYYALWSSSKVITLNELMDIQDFIENKHISDDIDNVVIRKYVNEINDICQERVSKDIRLSALVLSINQSYNEKFFAPMKHRTELLMDIARNRLMIKGCERRNFIFALYNTTLAYLPPKDRLKLVYEMNCNFNTPLSDSEVLCEIANAEYKYQTSGRYWKWSNEKLVTYLGLTADEIMTYFPELLQKEEKKQNKELRNILIMEYFNQGNSYRQIAEKLKAKDIDCSKNTVMRVIQTNIVNRKQIENQNKEIINLDNVQFTGKNMISYENFKEIVLSGYNIKVIGMAGTSKTLYIKHLEEDLRETTGYKQKNRIKICAFTGKASEVFKEGSTLHLMMGIKNEEMIKNHQFDENALNNFKKTKLIIIDEISLVGKKLFDYFIEFYKKSGCKGNIVIVGDFLQSKPVKDDFCFNSKYFDELNFKTILLKKNTRQTDKGQQATLMDLEWGKNKMQTIHNLNLLVKSKTIKDFNYDAFSVCLTKEQVRYINALQVQHRFKDDKPVYYNKKAYYLGMRVMITANNTKKCYFNGNLGTIKAFNKNSIRVILDNGRVVNVEYIMNKNNIIMPLEYGYAATVQKCQGMTFNRMNLIAMDLHNNETNNVFMEGQLYTALSRCVDLKKINLIGQPFKESDIKVNPYALRFQFNLYQCVS